MNCDPVEQWTCNFAHFSSGFVAALDKACGKFINANAVTKAANSSSKSPELLARYCDLLLKKSSKNPEEVIFRRLSRLRILSLYPICKRFFSRWPGWTGGYVESSDDRVQIHRRQRRVPKVLLENARQTPRSIFVRLRRRWSFYDLKTQAGSNLLIVHPTT